MLWTKNSASSDESSRSLSVRRVYHFAGILPVVRQRLVSGGQSHRLYLNPKRPYLSNFTEIDRAVTIRVRYKKIEDKPISGIETENLRIMAVL